ncbi:predicted protein [Naegleria gruberi]|uniref:Predicted protein n=1 Tax=Naegleria gruberi TaxID=5762 RepID=D2V1U9_NAEGR|nr:uncharacterized protein NAEGRDRAFT_62703 [Naegleria gruberi]EFC49225.1 predicted protein [Naegleria gruberi]|eukprot:XP_002681969.1 predicted protein [Naegleria gruberi strain NEG-M]
MNWKQIRENGVKKFLLWDDVYNIRIDLMLMSILLVLVISIVILFALDVYNHSIKVLLWLSYLVFTLICGGSTFIKELVIAIRKDRSPKSELEKLLENHSFRQLFKEYSTKELSLENFMFYEKLRELVSKYGMNGFIPHETLQQVENQFFKQDSPYELNIPSRTRKLFYALFENYEKPDSSSAELIEYANTTKVSDLYTIIYNDLLTNMSDTQSRLIETDVFQNWYAVFTIQRKQSVIIV